MYIVTLILPSFFVGRRIKERCNKGEQKAGYCVVKKVRRVSFATASF